MKTTQMKTASESLNACVLCMVMVVLPASHYICLLDGLYFSYIVNAIYRYGLITLRAILSSIFMGTVFCKAKIDVSRYEALFGVLLVCLVMSWRGAISPEIALYGDSGRNEGLIMLCCYYMFFYCARLVSNEKLRSIVVKFFILVMAVHSWYGLCQFYSFNWILPIFDSYFYAISGVAGNPNFMATLMVMASAATIGYTIYSKNKIEKVICGILTIPFIVTLIYTKTMSGYLGVSAVIAVVMLNFIFSFNKKHGKVKTVKLLLIMAILGIGAILLVNKLTYGIIWEEILLQFKNGINLETFASGRLLAWINILQMVPDYLLFGVGIDGLLQPYFERFGAVNGAFLDKAHNELLQMLITAGLPVFICYIALYWLVFKDLIKRIKTKENSATDMALLLILIGYICQAMFNISIVDIAPYFWIMLGLAARPIIKSN